MYKFCNYKDHYRTLLALGTPIVIGQLGTIAQSFADTLMIGRYGSLELSSAGFVNGLFMLAIVFSMGFSYGLTPVIGALFGRNEKHEVGAVLKNGMVANLFVVALVSVAMALVYVNLDYMGQPEELLPLIRPYFLVLLFSLIPVQIFYVFKQFTDCINHTSIGMWIIIGSNLFNIVGNYLLIYGKCGFPEMGLLGAGIATLVSRILMVAVCLYVWFFKKECAAYRRGFSEGKVTWMEFRKMNVLGWPLALQMGTETASFSLVAIMMGWISATALAAHQVLNTMGQLCFMVYYGLGAAMAIRVSNFMGQHDMVNVRRSAFAGFHLMLLSGFMAMCFIVLFRYPLTALFTEDEAIRQVVFVLMVPFCCYQLGDVMQATFANALRGIADVKMLMKYAFIAYILVSLPASYILGFIVNWGALGIWMGFPFGLTTAGVLFFLRFNKISHRLMNEYARKESVQN